MPGMYLLSTYIMSFCDAKILRNASSPIMKFALCMQNIDNSYSFNDIHNESPIAKY